MRSGTTQTEEAKLEIRRARTRAHNMSRDYFLLSKEREAARAKLPPHKLPAMRPCIGCRKPFKSKWCGHRMCKACRDMNL